MPWIIVTIFWWYTVYKYIYLFICTLLLWVQTAKKLDMLYIANILSTLLYTGVLLVEMVRRRWKWRRWKPRGCWMCGRRRTLMWGPRSRPRVATRAGNSIGRSCLRGQTTWQASAKTFITSHRWDINVTKTSYKYWWYINIMTVSNKYNLYNFFFFTFRFQY